METKQKTAWIVGYLPAYQEFLKNYMGARGYDIRRFLSGEQCLDELVENNEGSPEFILLLDSMKGTADIEIIKKQIELLDPEVAVVQLSMRHLLALVQKELSYDRWNSKRIVSSTSALDRLTEAVKRIESLGV